MKSTIKNNQFARKTFGSVIKTLLFIIVLANLNTIFAQFTFVGDYDKTFAAPNGYYTDPRDVDPTVEEYQTHLYTGELLADGSIIAGGRFVTSEVSGDFYVRKHTASGAVDTSFGTNGFVRTNFYTGGGTSKTNDVPYILKVQPDGKILFAGECLNLDPANNNQTPAFGSDACIVRYNANGTLDTTFGGFPLAVTGQGEILHSIPIEAGKAIFQTGVIANGQKFGTGGKFYDMVIQPDGKIVLVGETTNPASFFGTRSNSAIVVRLNANGSLDSTFGAGGFARWTAPELTAGCFPKLGFHGVQVQPDGRVLAVGQNEVIDTVDCGNRRGSRFVVTRWTSSGQLETVRYLDNTTTFNNQREGAGSILFTRDGNKILVSGTYRNLDGTSSHRPTMVRFNLSDLSVDTTFGSAGGVQQYNYCPNVECGFFSGGRLQVKAIQPDGKILGIDGGGDSAGNVVRFNPNGSGDQSFGNASLVNPPNGAGRLRVLARYYNGTLPVLQAGHILVRPNGRINLIGYGANIEPNFVTRAAISQHNTTFQNGIYADFENDGRDNISVFREGNWYWLNSVNNSFNAAQFGIASDKLAPADYDGDGRTDLAVFRDGAWYIIQSSNGAFRALNFGSAGDLPRPGDFDGDGLADISVFRPSNGTWYRINSGNNQFVGIQFGANGDVPLLADFDADGRTDIAVFRAGVWYWLRSSDNQFAATQFGIAGDIPVIGDYDADCQADLAVFRPSNGTWYWMGTQLGFNAAQFGANADKPVPGDYDNDGKNDLAVFRNGAWYIIFSGNNSFTGLNFGIANDRPIESAYTLP
jgi:uncharacterized delta-60 repeat protein